MKNIYALLLMICFVSCNNQKLSFSNVLCITNVDIIDAEQGLLEGRTVIIKDGIIIHIGDDSPKDIQGDSEIIDGQGKFLIPGLWDAHVHFAYIKDLAPKMFDLFMAYGITSVRDTGGDLNLVSKWKYLSEKDPTNTPRVKIAGPLMDGSPNVYDGSTSSRPKLSVELSGTQDVIINADQLIEAGVDFLKAYEMLTPEQFVALNNYANSNDLKVTGHVPLSMDVIAASDAGFDSMEHLRNLEMSCAVNSAELLSNRTKMLEQGINNKDSGHALRSRIHTAQRTEAIDNQDEQRTEAVLNALARNNTWQVPTLTLLTASTERPFESAEWVSTFDYLPDNVSTRFKNGVEVYRHNPVSDRATKFTKWAYAMTKKIHDKGIGIMTGTDCPIFFLTPGRSLHEELAEFAKAGIPPIEILKSATLRPAEYFNLQDKLGLIKESYHADLILLNDNPLEDIRNTMNIDAVIKAGTYHSHDKLMEKLK